MKRIIRVPAGTALTAEEKNRATKIVMGGIVVKDRFDRHNLGKPE